MSLQQQQHLIIAPPTSTLPTLKRLLSLLETSATTTSSSSNSNETHTRSLEIAAATSSLRQQLVDAEKYALGLPGGMVKEEQVEEIIEVLEGRVKEGRRTLASVSNLPPPFPLLLADSSLLQPANGDVAMSS